MSTIQKISGGPLIIKRPGAQNSLVNCGRIPREVFYSAHTRPDQFNRTEQKTKTRLTGRVTAPRYFEYLFKFKHEAGKKSIPTKSYFSQRRALKISTPKQYKRNFYTLINRHKSSRNDIKYNILNMLYEIST
jgi:hypothetical protein